ncbi:MAG TPA: type II toxin-antitoxin system RelE/ParE family toxin [Burkholderiaceae bacterium]
MIRVRFHPEAIRELDHELDFYADARGGVAARFLDRVEEVVDRAGRCPLSGAPAPAGSRGLGVRGFPFTVIYLCDERELLVIAIAPHRRRPAYWADRVLRGISSVPPCTP